VGDSISDLRKKLFFYDFITGQAQKEEKAVTRYRRFPSSRERAMYIARREGKRHVRRKKRAWDRSKEDVYPREYRNCRGLPVKKRGEGIVLYYKRKKRKTQDRNTSSSGGNA